MKTGILLINLGTPDSPSTADVRKYLTEFLNDPRVIDINPIARFFLVNAIIVPFRASKSAKLYQQIWTEKGSPLLIHGQSVKEKLQDALGDNYIVELGMRYQSPSIDSALADLREQKVSKIIVLPLYPQYASSSTESSIDKTKDVLRKWDGAPPVKIISKFYDVPGYIDSMVVIAGQYNLNEYDHFLFSYHGLPERHIIKDSAYFGTNTCAFGSCCDSVNANNQYCYRAACFETTRQLVKRLNIPQDKYTTAFQSRLNDKWLKPYSDKVVEEKAKQGIKRMLVFSPAFVADCLETIYEIGVEYNEIFREHGGEKLQLVESLNSHPKWIEALKQLVLKN
ncbi:MAG: ferrochelatase [Bacteroidetes bacterium]|nr:ferrochelatase [Bacteroidota bacterium]